MGGTLSRSEAVRLFAGADQRIGPPDRRRAKGLPADPTDEELIGIYAGQVGDDAKRVGEGLRAVWRVAVDRVRAERTRDG